MKDQAVWSILHKAWGINSHKNLITIMNLIEGWQLWQLDERAFKNQFSFISEENRMKFFHLKKTVQLEKVEQYLMNHDIKMIGYQEDCYPERLRHIYQPPAILYCKGGGSFDCFNIAMVGSRKCTEYGKFVAEKLSNQ